MAEQGKKTITPADDIDVSDEGTTLRRKPQGVKDLVNKVVDTKVDQKVDRKKATGGCGCW